MVNQKEAETRFHRHYAKVFLKGEETKYDVSQIAHAAELEPPFGPINLEAIERNISPNPDETIKGRAVLKENKII